ncbi:MAG: discoidin domain-containing protein [Clostridia bacterium]|jgi:exo-1,4-beta-D-glucosaminidase
MKKVFLFRSLIALFLVITIVNPIIPSEKNFAAVVSQKSTISLNTNDWKLQSSFVDTAAGELISQAAYNPSSWYTVSVPCTVMAGLLEAKYFGADFDVFYGNNLQTVSKSIFNNAWWYRKEFTLPASENGKEISIDFKGINYRAELWINGAKIKTNTEFVGTFREFVFDITDNVVCDGTTKNVIALKIMKPTANVELAFTFVNWSPAAPDGNMGIWNDVNIVTTGSVRVQSPLVVSKVDTDLKKAHLTTYAELSNHTGSEVTGTLYGTIAGPNGNFELTPIPITLNADEQNRRVSFTQIDIDNPELWWPRNMGDPTMHELTLNFELNGISSDTVTHKFGIREVGTEYINSSNRKFFVNGKRVLLRGAAPCPDMFQRRSSTKTKYIIDYVKDMNLNVLRFEGKMEDEELMDLCDKYGIMVIHGWCCCDAWQTPKKWNGENFTVAYESLKSQIKRLEIHPSMLVWMNGSDIYPDLKSVYETYIHIEEDLQWPNIIMSSAINSDVPDSWYGSEDAGCKMLGPYQWEPPQYWFEDKTIYDGARDVNFETCSGPCFPEPAVMKKFIPEDKLWPINNDSWVYHSTTSSNGRKTLFNFNQAITNRYGEGKNFYDYNMKTQISSYEANRSEMEAFGRNKYVKANAQIHWMMNNSWPTLEYQIFDSYFGTGGTYYGIKKALEPLHIQYAYDNHKVDIVNSTLIDYTGYSAEIDVYNLNGVKKYSAAVNNINIGADLVVNVSTIPVINNLSNTYFIRLKLKDANGKEISVNSYALSTTEDTLDWNAVAGMTGFKSIVPQKVFADMKSLQSLPAANLMTSAVITDHGDEEYADVTITNFSSTIAYGVSLNLKKGTNGDQLLPIRWADNYFMLLPNESRTIRATYYKEELGGATPVVDINCYNNICGGTQLKPWDGINLAFGKTVTASSEISASNALKANDRDPAASWTASTTEYPQWWKVDLGAKYNLRSVVSKWNSADNRVYKYKIEVSDYGNDDSYTTIVDKTGNTINGKTTDEFSASGRYVRITVTGCSDITKPADSFEFEVYGPAPVIKADPVVCNVKFNSNRGTAVAEQFLVKYATISKLPATSRKGYKFAGWHTALTGGTRVLFPYTVRSNVTLYAQWVKIPAIPANVSARHLTSKRIKVKWNKVSGAVGYMVYRAASIKGTYKLVSLTKYLSFTDTRFTVGKTQYYKVKAYVMMRKTKVFGNYSKIVKA